MSSVLENHNKPKMPVDVEVKSHHISHRKKIGAYYTPLTVSTILSTWGIRSADDLVLEPCFGGCTFLEAAIARLSKLGHPSPESNLFGCDIDPLAFSYLKTRIKPTKIAGHFFEEDFIKFKPEQLAQGKVDLIIGNPPYIRHSSFSINQRERVATFVKSASFKIHGRANLWAYFVLHALQFIKNGGRLALVLPGSFLYADYSASVRAYLNSNFESVTALTLAERLFVSEGTEEATVILLAEGFGRPSQQGDVRITCVENVDDLEVLVGEWQEKGALIEQAYPGHGLVPVEVGALHKKISFAPEMSTLGDIATIRIGLVTGNTPYFIKCKSEWKRLNINGRFLRYILPRSQYVHGVSIDAEDCTEHINRDVRCLALWTPVLPREKNLVNYLNSYPTKEFNNNSTFKRRSIWHRFSDGYGLPDAFFVFMAEYGPRIVLNRAQVNVTNSMYRVFFKKEISVSAMKLAVVSMCTTFSQLAAEINGHPRGSGALKLEPSGASNLTLYLPSDRSTEEIDEAFDLVNRKLRTLDAEGARHAADAFLFNKNELSAALPLLRTGLDIVRQRRIK